jgi:hypothetical protein
MPEKRNKPLSAKDSKRNDEIAVIAHNICKGAKFLTLYGFPDQSSDG